MEPTVEVSSMSVSLVSLKVIVIRAQIAVIKVGWMITASIRKVSAHSCTRGGLDNLGAMDNVAPTRKVSTWLLESWYEDTIVSWSL